VAALRDGSKGEATGVATEDVRALVSRGPQLCCREEMGRGASSTGGGPEGDAPGDRRGTQTNFIQEGKGMPREKKRTACRGRGFGEKSAALS